MQRYAEEAVSEHVAKYLQPRFFKEKSKKKSNKKDKSASIINPHTICNAFTT